MIDTLLAKVFGTKQERDIKRLRPTVEAINAREPAIERASDDELRAQIADLRTIIQTQVADAPEEESAADRETRIRAILDERLVDVFAIVREAAKRSIGLRPFDVQLMGGVILHHGKIAEMKTGEGKTLVATMPVVLNALAGRGVHVVTVNDYLARRDSEWMGQVYRFLGLTVGCIQHSLDDRERQQAYGCDITYGTNNEYGFDYLRDNMKFDIDSMVQRRGHAYAIVDEVDSILIDEARTPLIISGPSEESTDSYYGCDRIVPRLIRGEEKKDDNGDKYTVGDYLVDEKAHTVVLTEEGIAHAEKLLGVDNLYDPSNMDTLHCVNQALRAHVLYRLDVDYVINDGQIVIVDEFTGRLMPGRRWSDGLHQAVEAKEGVKIEAENQTLATITFQNYFRMYHTLAGMTGTADTEAVEFDKIYKLEVVVALPNRDMIREDYPDVVYRTEPEKFAAVVEEVEELHAKGQPVLVGTISIEKSEVLAALLKSKKIPHVVLNAKYHEKEAEIVAQAGKKGAVTIATNMAGRGTDIVLGGNPEYLVHAKTNRDTSPEERQRLLAELREQCSREHEEVVALGGLHILGTERHESRRIDNQLRGRAGRQGDPGSSRFYLSLEDDLMRIFGSDRISGLMQRLGMEEGVPIEHNMVTRAIKRAQTQVEGRNFEVRKHLLEYDDVMNKQRESIYKMRRDILEGREGKSYFLDLARDIVDEKTAEHCPSDKDPRDWTLAGLEIALREFFSLDLAHEGIRAEELGLGELRERLYSTIERLYQNKEDKIGPEMMRLHEKYIALQIVDSQWKDHLLNLDHLKEGIGMRAYGQRDPLVEYKKESFTLFEELKERVEDDIIKFLYRLQVVVEAGAAGSEDAPRPAAPLRRPPAPRPPRQVAYNAPPKDFADAKPDTMRRASTKVGRNEPCPCGSGKKYKKCHGIAA